MALNKTWQHKLSIVELRFRSPFQLQVIYGDRREISCSCAARFTLHASSVASLHKPVKTGEKACDAVFVELQVRSAS